MKRLARKKVVLGLILCGGMLTQLGPCINAGLNTFIAAIDFCAPLGPDCVLGPLAPCGDPTTALDDLLVDCPPPIGTTP